MIDDLVSINSLELIFLNLNLVNFGKDEYLPLIYSKMTEA